MAAFLSKLQLKTYEKGEFSDEKPRDLDDTLKFIKDFPCEKQRGADVQLTGPGVVIENENNEYLKVGLYFNGKFCIYYLDADHHLYEYYTDDFTRVLNVINNYFEGSLNLDGFEKHFFNIGNKAHLITRSFEYTINPITEYLRIGFISVAVLVYLIFAFVAFFTHTPYLLPVLILCFTTLLIAGDLMMIRLYSRAENLVLTISKGNDTFEFGDKSGQVNSYSKLNIQEINFYGAIAGKGKQILTIIEIVFKDGQTIKFPGMLIEPFEFLFKLPDGIKRTEIKQHIFYRKSVWEF